jgi:hypothetical protein
MTEFGLTASLRRRLSVNALATLRGSATLDARSPRDLLGGSSEGLIVCGGVRAGGVFGCSGKDDHRDLYGGDLQFGLSSSQLIGQTVKAVYTIDDTKGVSVYDAPFGSQIYGGPAFRTTSPVSAAITVNGITAKIGGTLQSQASQATLLTGQATEMYNVQNRTAISSGYHDVFSGEGAFSRSDPFVKSYDYHVAPGVVPLADIGNGLFGENWYDKSFNLVSFSQFAWLPTSLTIAGGVPEPAAWALVLAGFGLAGTALRRRVRAVV